MLVSTADSFKLSSQIRTTIAKELRQPHKTLLKTARTSLMLKLSPEVAMRGSKGKDKGRRLQSHQLLSTLALQTCTPPPNLTLAMLLPSRVLTRQAHRLLRPAIQTCSSRIVGTVHLPPSSHRSLRSRLTHYSPQPAQVKAQCMILQICHQQSNSLRQS